MTAIALEEPGDAVYLAAEGPDRWSVYTVLGYDRTGIPVIEIFPGVTAPALSPGPDAVSPIASRTALLLLAQRKGFVRSPDPENATGAELWTRAGSA